MLLLSAVYSGEEKKVYLKFYDPQDNIIYLWRDRTDHRPYCYTKMEFAEQAERIAQKESKYTLVQITGTATSSANTAMYLAESDESHRATRSLTGRFPTGASPG